MLKRALIVCLLSSAVFVDASLIESYQFVGNGNWSLDAVGSNNEPVGILQAYVPEGSTVEKAFLYSSKVFGSTDAPTVSFDGIVYDATNFTALGLTNNLQAFRLDVTDQVKNKVGNGSSDRYDFSIDYEIPNSKTDGEILAIVYSNPSEVERTIAFLDGFSDQDADVVTFTFDEPMPDPSSPGFEALLSLGIGYGYQPSGQYSQVDINGRRLTTSAGGQDDGVGVNGGLITVGGLDDDPSNPSDPYQTDIEGYRYDDELYDLTQGNMIDNTPFISEGITSFTMSTSNPSFDDNIFFMGINVTAVGDVNSVPEPCSAAFFVIGLTFISLFRRKRK